MADDDETLTPAEMRAHIEEAPEPCEEGATRPYELMEADSDEGLGEGYGMAARSLARGILICCEADGTLLDLPDDPTEAAFATKVWEAFKERYPEGDEWLGGTTGYQFGWAHNAVRYALGAEPVGNPAVMTVEVPDD